jgi:hypothetical protein
MDRGPGSCLGKLNWKLEDSEPLPTREQIKVYKTNTTIQHHFPALTQEFILNTAGGSPPKPFCYQVNEPGTVHPAFLGIPLTSDFSRVGLGGLAHLQEKPDSRVSQSNFHHHFRLIFKYSGPQLLSIATSARTAQRRGCSRLHEAILLATRKTSLLKMTRWLHIYIHHSNWTFI